MTEGRKGHAAAAINTSDMIVAGGWDERGRELSSVYLYSLVEDEWKEMPHMPKSRVDFVLKVPKVLLPQNHDMGISIVMKPIFKVLEISKSFSKPTDKRTNLS